MTQITPLSLYKSFDGEQHQFSHFSTSTQCEMRVGIYLPPQIKHQALPVLYWLSGLTCTDENFTQKAGAQRIAAELGVVVVCPDTSPRGDGVPDDENQSYDLGLGAGFYVNATQKPWATHYNMYDYVVHELPELISTNFNVSDQRMISGHSMGGHGALMIALKNPSLYQAASAFSPISHPSECPWGQKAFTHYLGTDKSTWAEWDSCLLMENSVEQTPMLVHQGLADNFLAEQLNIAKLISTAKVSEYPLTVREVEGYDHSYFFIASFIEEHIRFLMNKINNIASRKVIA